MYTGSTGVVVVTSVVVVLVGVVVFVGGEKINGNDNTPNATMTIATTPTAAITGLDISDMIPNSLVLGLEVKRI